MKILSLLILVLASLPALGEGPAPGEGARLLAELNGLVSRGKREQKLCRRFEKKWKNVVGGGLSAESPSHLSKKQALDTLALMEKYPGTAPSFAEAHSLLAGHAAEFAELPDQAVLIGKASEIIPECEMFSYLTHASLLLKDVKVFGFNKKESARVRHRARDYLLKGPPFQTLAGAGVKGTFFERYVENIYEGEDRDSLLQKAKAYLDEYEAKRTQVAEERKQLSFGEKKSTIAFWFPDWQAQGQLSQSFSALMDGVQF